MLAGVKDLSRPAEKLSVSQNVALAATGFIWVGFVSSWPLIIRSAYRVIKFADDRPYVTGPILFRHHPCQLLPRCRQLLRWVHWCRSALSGVGLQEEKPWSRVKRLTIGAAQEGNRSSWKIRLVVGYPYPSAYCHELTSNGLMAQGLALVIVRRNKSKGDHLQVLSVDCQISLNFKLLQLHMGLHVQRPITNSYCIYAGDKYSWHPLSSPRSTPSYKTSHLCLPILINLINKPSRLPTLRKCIVSPSSFGASGPAANSFAC